MRKQFKCLIISNILLLSILIVHWDVDSNANNIDNDLENLLIPKSNNNPRSEGFDWGEIEVISEPVLGQDNNIVDSDEPKIVIENDKIYTVWRDWNNTSGAGLDRDIFYRFFDGNTWSKIQVISEPIAGKNFNIKDSSNPDIAVENGKIYVVWKDSNNTNNAGDDPDIFYRTNLTGKGWEQIQVISEPVINKNINIEHSFTPKISVENGKVYVIWNDFNNTNKAGEDSDIFYRCNINGNNWEDIQVISEPIFGKNFNVEDSGNLANGYLGTPAIAVENGKIYVVWQDKNNTNNASNTGYNYDIFYRCNLTGYKWENIQVISEPFLNEDNNIKDSLSPDIAVEKGRIYIIWQDENNTNGAGNDFDIFYRSNLTGINWELIQIISEPIKGVNSNVKNSYDPKIIVENGRVYTVWLDDNNTNNAGNEEDGKEGEIFYRCKFYDSYWEPFQVISEPISGSNFNTEASYNPDIAVEFGKAYVVWESHNLTNGASWDKDIFFRYVKDPSQLFLNFPSLIPHSGNTSTVFNFTITYFHYDTTPPTEIIVNISGVEYPMIQVDQADTNYVDGKDYYYNIRKLNIGVNPYQFNASDNKFTWSTRIVNKLEVFNTNPSITTENNLIAYEDVYYEMDYNYDDIDLVNIGQSSHWNCSTNASWLKFEPTTAILNGTPTNDDVGEYWINITIYDTMDIDFTNFTLNVINVNDAPIIITDDIEVINEDEVYDNYYKATDVDSSQNNLFWNLETNASWLDFENHITQLTGIPLNDNVGEFWVNISVNDKELFDYSNFTLEVININDPPRIITKDNTTAFEDEFYEVIYKVEDIDNEYSKLSWNINTNAKWLNYDIPNAIINGTPTNDDIGVYWVNISVSDNEFIDFTNFTLVVINTNDPPMIITDDKTNATAGELFSMNYEANDIDPPPIFLEWSLKSNTSRWLSIDPLTGWLTGTPSDNDVGTFWVNISVTDGKGGWDHHNFTLQIIKLKQKQNIKPILTNPVMTPTIGDIKTKFTFSIHYYDPDNDTPVFIQLILDNAVYNMQLIPNENVSNGTYITSAYLTLGEHDYYFTASDGIQTVRTDNLMTSFISKESGTSQVSTFIYWIILIIILIIVFSLLFELFYKKRKAEKIQVVKAELLTVAPKHIAMAGELAGAKTIEQLPQKPVILDQLSQPEAKALPVSTDKADVKPMELMGTSSVQPQFQLPQTTLSKEQKLGLLQERFLRSEVDLKTYKKLKAEIEGNSGGDNKAIEEDIKD